MYYEPLGPEAGGAGKSFDEVVAFCWDTMICRISQPTQTIVDYHLERYLEDLQVISSLNITVDAHYVGFMKQSSGDWQWIGVKVQPVPHTSWAEGEPGATGECAIMDTKRKLATVSCDLTDLAAVCYEDLLT